MSTSTAIQWTDVTDNIIVVEGGGWWCRMISPGCAHCYAAKLNQSEFFGGNKLPYSGEAPKIRLRTDIVDGWAKQTKPKRHFVASMTDVFGEWVTWPMALRFLRGMWCAPKQTFQVLTKRPQVMADYVKRWLECDMLSQVPDNIWPGVSVEDQKRADERVPILLSIPAKVRFLSVEPMLELINLGLPHRDKPGPAIDWCIVGGESGVGARHCATDWVREVVAQCRETNTAPFVKQLGRNPEWSDRDMTEKWYERFSDPKGGDMAEWPHDLRVREFPTV